MESQDFVRMLAAIREGDAEAVEALLRRYEPYLRRIIRMRLHDSQLARVFDSIDVCQSILASFLVRAANGQFVLDNPVQLRNLLVKMALNKLVTRARALGLEVGNLPAEWDAVDPAPSLLEQLANADLAAAILDRLSAEERDLVDRHVQRNQTWDDIAREKGESADALRMRRTRALARVRK